jgi:hypothetical protein
MARYIRCRDCEYAKNDRNASDYTPKHCGSCDRWEDCPICFNCTKRNTCTKRQNQKLQQSCERRHDTICPEQEIVWTAFQCTNSESEYYRSLLNVTYGGDRQSCITWSGCQLGERSGI